MGEQGQPPPETEGGAGQQGAPPADERTTPAAGPRAEGTTDRAQASDDSDERQQAGAGQPGAPAEDAGEAAGRPATRQEAPPISWGTLSPEDRRRLLDEADPDFLRSHERVAGLSGQMAERLYRRRVGELRLEDLPDHVRESLAQKVKDDWERERQLETERQLGQQGEFYTLGQQRWNAIQSQRTEEQRRQAEEEAERRALAGFWKDVERWALEHFPGEVVDRTAARISESGKMDSLDPKAQYHLWLKTLNETHAEHVAEQRARQERDRWEKEEIPAYRQRWLAERNGSEPSPETEGGPPPGARVVTDEDIRRMSPEEFEAIWGEDGPKEGVVYRPTSALNLREMQVRGRSQ